MKRLLFLIIVSAAAVTTCGPASFPVTEPQPVDAGNVDAVVYLIGDVGAATGETQILIQLKQDLIERSREAEVVVAFLGDNIYERGLHEPSHPDHAKDAAHLEAQIEVLRGTSAKGVFIPGNHDWGYGGKRGVEQIKRQAAYLAEAARDGTDVALRPQASCPGPETIPVVATVLLIALETDLWLRDVEEEVIQACENRSTSEALDALGRVLQENAERDDRQVVLLAHHPLKTYGPHGGYFGLTQWLFPLTNLWKPLYIPIPLLYPIARKSGVRVQDISNPRNTRMREGFGAVFAESSDRPLVWAAGHEHGLQVFEGGEYNLEYILVSGAGSGLNPVGHDDALFAVGEQQRELGYMRLDFLEDGHVLLTVNTDGSRSCNQASSSDCSGEPTVRYWRWLN